MRGYRNACKAAIGTPEMRSFPAPPPVGSKSPGNSGGVYGLFILGSYLPSPATSDSALSCIISKL